MSITVIVEFSPKPECTDTRKQLALPLKCGTYLAATILSQLAQPAWDRRLPAPHPVPCMLRLGLNQKLISALKWIGLGLNTTLMTYLKPSCRKTACIVWGLKRTLMSDLKPPSHTSLMYR